MTLFDFEQHAEKAELSTKILNEAIEAEALAIAGHEAAVLKLDEFEATMKVGDAAKLNTHRATVDIAEAVKDRAVKAVRSAKRRVLNCDYEGAEALRPMAERLAVGNTTILCVPGPLPEVPSLSDWPVLVLQQQVGAYRLGDGSLATGTSRDEVRRAPGILLTRYSRADLHMPVTGDQVYDAAMAANVAIENMPSDLRPIVTVQGSVRIETWTIRVTAAFPPIPTFETEDLDYFDRSVNNSVRSRFQNLGDKNALAGGSGRITSVTIDGDGLRTVTVECGLAFHSSIGSHEEQLDIVHSAIAAWKGRALPYLGRCIEAGFIADGVPSRHGPYWGRDEMKASFRFVSYVPETAEAA